MVIHFVDTGWPNYVTNFPKSINSCFSTTVKMFPPHPMVYDFMLITQVLRDELIGSTMIAVSIPAE